MSTPYSRAVNGNRSWRYCVVDLFVLIKGEQRHLHGLKDSLDSATTLPSISLSYYHLCLRRAASVPLWKFHLSHCHMLTIVR